MRNTIHNTDFRKVFGNIPDGAVDGMFTDPPFNIDLQPQRGTHGNIANDALSPAEYHQLINDFAHESYRIIKPDSAIWVCCNWQCVDSIGNILRDAGFSIPTWVVWDKMMFGIGYDFRPQHEFILPCYKGKPAYPVVAPSNVWSIMRLIETIHPNEKPIELIQKALRMFNKEGDWIVDPFAGSFSTCIAARLLGMDYTGCELLPHYFETGKQRLSETVLRVSNAKGKTILRNEGSPLSELMDKFHE